MNFISIPNNLESDFLTETYPKRTPNNPSLYIDANNYSANLHYLGKLDTTGSSISADIDFVKITNRGESNFYNYYEDLASPK